MQFNRLRLNGFKSFVDPTDLLIAPGLTGVVGPNGCGKSNLLEALRWVMGENRPKAMRGGGMEDVIFAGASSRPARNFAEVGLVIDNSERLAPSGFNDSDTLEIVRRITRDAGSAYKVNTKDVRARDVQMLFADASTGAHSPALVRQGQISELINARPKSRRRILEEAAGISGLYQRRHEAELKLNGAETNLARVEDVLEQLRSQLGTLARQARQAARYREIGTKLRQNEGLLLYRRWKEAQQALVQAQNDLGERTKAAAQAQAAASAAMRAREEADGKVPPLREEETVAAAILQRLQVERDGLKASEDRALQAIETLKGRIDQLGRDIDRETGLNQDAGQTIERLEWEQAQLAKASEGQGEKLEAAAEEARAAASVLKDREAELDELTEDVARLSARHQSAHRLREDAQKALARNEDDANRARATVAQAKAAVEAAGQALATALAAQKDAESFAQAAEAGLIAADDGRAQAQTREAEARAEHSEAEGEASALRAEVAALARMVERETAEDAQLLDLLQVQPGYEAALGAALADDLRLPQIDGSASGSGWRQLGAYAAPQSLPTGVRSLSGHVTVPGVLARRMAQVGIVDAAEGPKLQEELRPGQRLVSVEGDLWRWDGFCAAAEDAPSAAALRLQQINRLVELRRDLEEANAKAEGAARAHAVLAERLVEATAADREARAAQRDADQAMTETSRAVSRAEADRDIAAGKLENASMAVARHEEEAMAARARLDEADAAVAELGDLDTAKARVEDLRMTMEAARLTMLTKRSAHDELRREGEARTRRAQEVIKEISGWRHRLQTAEKRISELRDRRAASEAELKDATATPGEIAAKREELSRSIDTAEARRKAAADALAAGETLLRQAEDAERAAERAASEARESRARADAVADAARIALEAAAERIEEELETTPEDLLETLDTLPENMPGAEQVEAEIHRLRRQRDALGSVNLRAEEDAREVQEELETLDREKTDLDAAIAKLRTGISSLNREGRERLVAAFDEVNRNFSTLFKHLFGGGEANLVLVESDDPLEAGLEIMCQPPGKKLSTLSLLSGGEQTLTALSLIFAVFLANPSPICVLDEVDAPLDDANVTRFCDLLDEMTRRTDTRFLIITHHAVTMGRMDRLFGVTMAEQGVSQLVSVDLKKAEALVA